MKIAIVNLMTKTPNIPINGLLKEITLPKPHFKTDEDSNIIELGMEFARQGHKVTIYASDAFLPEHSLGNRIKGLSVKYLKTECTNIFPYLYFPFTPSLYRELVDNEYDIIQSGEFCQISTIFSALASSKKHVPLVIWHELGVKQRFPGNFIQTIYSKTLGKIVLKKTQSVIPRSSIARDWLIKNGVPEDKLSLVIHTGVDTNLFFPLKANSDLKIKLHVPNENTLIGSVCRLHAYKGLDSLIRAMRFVVDKNPKVTLIIKGDGPERIHLENLIAELALQEHVKILGYSPKKELNEFYNACDFTVLTSKKEQFPNFSIIESLACGKPVIHSSLLGERDLGGPGFSSFYVKCDDIAALTDKILFLTENSDIRKKMGRNALDLAKSEYGLDKVVKRFLCAYNVAN